MTAERQRGTPHGHMERIAIGGIDQPAQHRICFGVLPLLDQDLSERAISLEKRWVVMQQAAYQRVARRRLTIGVLANSGSGSASKSSALRHAQAQPHTQP